METFLWEKAQIDYNPIYFQFADVAILIDKSCFLRTRMKQVIDGLARLASKQDILIYLHIFSYSIVLN
jgi:hypothetical protein